MKGIVDGVRGIRFRFHRGVCDWDDSERVCVRSCDVSAVVKSWTRVYVWEAEIFFASMVATLDDDAHRAANPRVSWGTGGPENDCDHAHLNRLGARLSAPGEKSSGDAEANESHAEQESETIDAFHSSGFHLRQKERTNQSP